MKERNVLLRIYTKTERATGLEEHALPTVAAAIETLEFLTGVIADDDAIIEHVTITTLGSEYDEEDDADSEVDL